MQARRSGMDRDITHDAIFTTQTINDQESQSEVEEQDLGPSCATTKAQILMRLREIETHLRGGAMMEYESQQKFSRHRFWRLLTDDDKEKKREKKIRSAVVSRMARRRYEQWLEIALRDIEDGNQRLRILSQAVQQDIVHAEQSLNRQKKTFDKRSQELASAHASFEARTNGLGKSQDSGCSEEQPRKETIGESRQDDIETAVAGWIDEDLEIGTNIAFVEYDQMLSEYDLKGPDHVTRIPRYDALIEMLGLPETERYPIFDISRPAPGA